jgi:hypothetical protein
MLEFWGRYWWIWLAGGVALAWGLSLVLVRFWTRKRLLKALSQEGLNNDGVEIELDDPRPEDQQALELIRSRRRRFLLNLWPDTRFTLGFITEMAQNLVKDIARVYYPEEERPELKASLADLVALYSRVGARLTVWLDTLPIRPFKELELLTIFQYHELYQKVKQHPGYLFLKRHHLDKAARWAWTVKNLLNPWYWSRRVAYTGSKELLQRLFLAKVTTLAGEEAIRLYSRRPLNRHAFRRCQAAVRELLHLAESDGPLPPQLTQTLLRFIVKARGLEPGEKLALLNLMLQPAPEEPPGVNGLEGKNRLEARRLVEKLAAECWEGQERDQRLARFQARLTENG